MEEQETRKLRFTLRRTQHREHVAGTALLHRAGLRVDIERAALQQPLRRKGKRFRRHVVNVADKLADLPVRLAAPGLIRALAPQRAHAVRLFKLLCAHADPRRVQRHRRHRAEGFRQFAQQRRAGGRAGLALHRAAVNRNPLQQRRCGGSGNRHHAVRTPHRAAAHMHRRGRNAVRVQEIHRIAHARHIGHRVQRAHLVEVHFLHRHAVRLRLRRRNRVIHAAGTRTHLLRQGQAVDQSGNLPRRGVVMMRMAVCMVMHMLVFHNRPARLLRLRTVHMDVHRHRLIPKGIFRAVHVFVDMFMFVRMLMDVSLIVLVIMLAAFLLTVHEDTHVRAADAGRHAALGTDLHAGD